MELFKFSALLPLNLRFHDHLYDMSLLPNKGVDHGNDWASDTHHYYRRMNTLIIIYKNIRF